MNWLQKIQLFIKKEWFLLVMIGVLSILVLVFEIFKQIWRNPISEVLNFILKLFAKALKAIFDSFQNKLTTTNWNVLFPAAIAT